MYSLERHLELKGIDHETIRENVILFMWDLPCTNKEIQKHCEEWWDMTWRKSKNGQELERTENKTT